MTYLDFIEIKNLHFEYVNGRPIFNNLSLRIRMDEVTALLGSNGSGKTTLGKLIMGILKPIRGQVLISNRDNSKMTLAEIGSKIGYLFQNPEKHFFCNTVEEELGFALKFNGCEEAFIKNRVEGLLKEFQLEGLRESFPLLLSQGEKRRLAIATILINEPEYMILDEPTNGLDFERKRILVGVLRELTEKGVGMTIISHDHSFIEEVAHRKIEIHRGEIIYDQRI
ncbi:energy-coupling factor ABC transporter ATP-binding protein [Tepidimicrobium xylanilyticum]